MKNGEALGNKLYACRKKAGLSQEELADKMGVSRQAISKWECGESLPDVDNLISLAKIYGISLDELVEHVPAAEPETSEGTKTTETTEEVVVENTIGRALNEEELDEREEREEEAYFSYDGTPADKKRKVLRTLHALPYPVLVCVLFLVWGFVWNGWWIAWTLFVTVPVYYSVLSCIARKRFSPFCYPVFITFIYLLIGMQWGLWHPWWILYVTIPCYYSVANYIDRINRRK